MESSRSIERDLGRIEAQQIAQDYSIQEIKNTQAAMSAKLDTLIAAENNRSGGSKYLLLLLTVAASAGAIIDRGIAWLKLV